MPTRRSRWRCARRRSPKRRRRSQRREVFAILDIPAGTEREVLAGRRRACRPMSIRSISCSTTAPSGHPRSDGGASPPTLLSRERGPDGSLYRAALAAKLPVEVLNQPLFNPDRRLCQLCRARGLHADPAADPASWASATLGGVAFEQGGRGGAPAPRHAAAVLGQGARASAAGAAGRRAVPGRPAARLRLLGHGQLGDLLACRPVHPLGQLPRPVRRRLVQAPRDGGPAVHRHQPAAVLPGRRRLAGRGDPAAAAGGSFIFPSTSAIDGLVRINQMDATLPTSSATGRGSGSLPLLYGVLAILPRRLFMSERSTRCARGLGNVCSHVGCSRGRAIAGFVVFLAAHAATADCRHGPPDRDPHRAGDHRPAASIAVRPASLSARAICWPCSTIPSWPPPLARQRRRRQRRAERDRVYSGVRAEEVAILGPGRRDGRGQPLLAAAAERARRGTGGAGLRQPAAARREHRLACQGRGRSRAQARPACGASAGPTAEERALADARVALAEATVADLQAKLDKTRLVAPVDGTVASSSPNRARSCRSASRC